MPSDWIGSSGGATCLGRRRTCGRAPQPARSKEGSRRCVSAYPRCGSGPLAAALRAKGAVVTGFDASTTMVALARQRLGEDADLHVADLGSPLPFADAEFHDVVASLVPHYLADWAGPLSELRRVLKPGGRLILSVIHPSVYAIVDPEADYFALTKYSEDYNFDGQGGPSSVRLSARSRNWPR